MTQDKLEQKNINLQNRVWTLEDKIYKSIELIKKGNIEKALKILKKVLYEK